MPPTTLPRGRQRAFLSGQDVAPFSQRSSCGAPEADAKFGKRDANVGIGAAGLGAIRVGPSCANARVVVQLS
ncbi:unnamed protein product [Arabidopsis lyrata]|nr:unnamed protein product [Arabidopsis lyrata]